MAFCEFAVQQIKRIFVYDGGLGVENGKLVECAHPVYALAQGLKPQRGEAYNLVPRKARVGANPSYFLAEPFPSAMLELLCCGRSIP